MFCPKCGKEIPENAKFCGGCGNPIQMTAKPAMQGNSPKPPKPQKQDMQPKLPKVPEKQVQANLPSGMAMAQNTRDEERKNRKLTIILSIVLIMLVLMAVGIGVYYFKVLRDKDNDLESDRIVVSEDEEEDPEQHKPDKQKEQDKQEEQTDQEDQEDQGDQGDQNAETPEAEEIVGVVSDTNEVVGDRILENIPKAVYSYRFDEDLGNAKVVVRSEGDTMPETADDVEAQFIHGIDGKAVYLDGTYGIELSDVEKLGESYTVAFWMKADELEDWSPFIHIGHDLLNSEGRSRLWLGKKPDASVAPIISSERVRTDESFEIRPKQSVLGSMKTDVWYHIVLTVDESKQGSKKGRVLGTLYVAGQYICEGDIVPGMMNEDDLSVYLGINCWDTLYPVAFDEVKIWDQVLDEQQIQELYEAYE